MYVIPPSTTCTDSVFQTNTSQWIIHHLQMEITFSLLCPKQCLKVIHVFDISIFVCVYACCTLFVCTKFSSCKIPKFVHHRKFKLELHEWLSEHDYYFLIFSVRLLSVLRGHSFFSSPPQRPMTPDIWRIFYPRFYPLQYFPILILEKEPVLPFLMFSAKQGNQNKIMCGRL